MHWRPSSCKLASSFCVCVFLVARSRLGGRMAGVGAGAAGCSFFSPPPLAMGNRLSRPVTLFFRGVTILSVALALALSVSDGSPLYPSDFCVAEASERETTQPPFALHRHVPAETVVDMEDDVGSPIYARVSRVIKLIAPDRLIATPEPAASLIAGGGPMESPALLIPRSCRRP